MRGHIILSLVMFFPFLTKAQSMEEMARFYLDEGYTLHTTQHADTIMCTDTLGQHSVYHWPYTLIYRVHLSMKEGEVVKAAELHMLDPKGRPFAWYHMWAMPTHLSGDTLFFDANGEADTVVFDQQFPLGMVVNGELTLLTYYQDPSGSLPEQILVIRKGKFTVLDIQFGHLNQDTLIDAVVVLRYRDETKRSVNLPELERPTLIYTQREDGEFVLRARNDGLVECRRCGGYATDAFDGLSLDGNRIVIRNCGSFAGANGCEGMEFVYDQQFEDWMLERTTANGYVPDSGFYEEESTRAEFGDIRFEDH